MAKFPITNYKLQTHSEFRSPKFLSVDKRAKREFRILSLGHLILLGIWCLALGILWNSIANAQSAPQFMVSWQADSYAPPWYQGKIFPTRNSTIVVNFELVNNGKIINLSKNIVRWYINDELIINEKNGLGIKSLKFTNNNPPGSDVEVKIVVLGYGSKPLYKIVHIPVAAPEAVIDAPYYGRKINRGKNFFRLFPFFFNIKNPATDLSFEWRANGRAAEPGENPEKLSLNVDLQTPAGVKINVEGAIKNLTNQFEFASKNIQLEVK